MSFFALLAARSIELGHATLRRWTIPEYLMVAVKMLAQRCHFNHVRLVANRALHFVCDLVLATHMCEHIGVRIELLLTGAHETLSCKRSKLESMFTTLLKRLKLTCPKPDASSSVSWTIGKRKLSGC